MLSSVAEAELNPSFAGQFLDEPTVLFDCVVQIFDLQDFDQPEPTVQNQQTIYVLQSGQVHAA